MYKILILSSESKKLASIVNQAGHIATCLLSFQQLVEAQQRSNEYDLAVIDVGFLPDAEEWTLVTNLNRPEWGKALRIILLAKSHPGKFIQNPQIRNSYDRLLFFPVSDEEILGSIERVMKRT